jgi:cholesterol oxidase
VALAPESADLSPTVNDADVIVIGSGFGGAIAAHRVAMAGRKVIVLERGPWRDSLPVRSMGIADRAPLPFGWRAFTHLVRNVHLGPISLNVNKTGMYEVCVYRGLSLAATSGVGGGSHAWDAALAPPQDPNYWKARHPNLADGEVERHHETVVRDLGAVRPSRDHWLGDSVWTQLPPSPGRRCTPADVQPHVAMLLPRSAADAGRLVAGADGLQRAVCAFDGDTFLGSKRGAKASVDFIYLAPAIARGAIVRDMCEVTRIERRASGGYSIRFRDLRSRANGIIGAPKIVLAAGNLNTQRLLFASLGGSAGLHPMPSLGRCFGANGDMMGFWFRQKTQPSMFESAPFLGQFEVDGKTTPSLVLAGLPGVDTLPMPAFLKRKLANTVMVLGMDPDSGNGVVSYLRGRLRLRYDHREEPAYDRIRHAIRALEEDDRGSKTWTIPAPLSVHPWGGACLGPDAEHGVIDHRGEIYGNPGLFVADGAALPAAPGAPPTLSIAAWAHHVGERLTQDVG